jgi:hypothetical protein
MTILPRHLRRYVVFVDPWGYFHNVWTPGEVAVSDSDSAHADAKVLRYILIPPRTTNSIAIIAILAIGARDAACFTT